MKKLKLFMIVLCSIISTQFIVAQTTGVPGACGYPNNQRSSGPQSPQNGNGTLGNIFSMTKCGLDFTSASQRLGKRLPQPGVNQPAPFVIAGIPAGSVIEKAYLWVEGSGNGAAQTATVNGPLGPAAYPMSVVGSGPDKCWGYTGSYTYRADVTASVNGNGVYNISGIMTNPPIAGNDMDGGTLIVIWSQATQLWRGTISISDGAMVVNGGVATYNMTYPAVCGVTTNAKAFMGIGDIQFNPTSWSANGTAIPLGWNWWDFLQVNTTVAVAQTTSAFVVNTGGDCFNLCIAGLYYRTTCVSCMLCTLATTNITNVLCNGQCTGSATVTSTGQAPFNYVWVPAAANTTTGLTNTATGLCAGTYVCTTTDALGCISTQTITITQPTPLVATNTSFTNVTCNSACNGTSVISSSGGVLPYTFTWSPATTNSTVGNVNTATGLCPGVYTCTVMDVNGCTSTTTTTITQPTALTLVPSQVNVLCNGVCSGSATVSVSGGTPIYSYLWSPGNQITPSITNLCAGNYSCLVTDANGCTLTQTFAITEPSLLTLAAGGFNVSCFGVCDGQVVVIPSGGAGSYGFLWNTGCITPSCNNICAGNYTVAVTDLNGCTATATATVSEPSAVVVTATSTDAHCNFADGSATCIYSGGTGGLIPIWYNPAIIGQNLVGVFAGNYYVIVTDANGCDDTAFVTINNIAGVSATQGVVTNVSCFGGNNGSASVIATGGTGIITYVWSCSPSVTSTATGLSAGNCTVTATDSAGCTSIVNITITQPAQLIANAISTAGAICVGQSSTLTGSGIGGTLGYTYLWNPGAMNGPVQTVSPITTTTYTLTITDANGCVSTAPVTVVVNQNPVALFTGDSLSGCVPHCVNFTDISTLVSGTITGWSWDFGDISSGSILQNPIHCYTTPGNYSVILTVTSSTGCMATLTLANYVNVFPNPIADFSASPQPTTELNPTVYFLDQSTYATTWLWDFGGMGTSIIQNPSFTYDIGAGCYDVKLMVTTNDGCTDTTVQEICIGPDVALFVPNAFSPNGDNVNDFFSPQGIGMDPNKYQFWVFDRWGNLIFYSDDMSKGWDGTVQGNGNICQIDTYVWKLRASDLLGRRHNIIGHVNLIR